MEVAIKANLGFSTADAEEVQFSYDNQNVILKFIDMHEIPHIIKINNAIAVKWQEADSLGPEERDDMAYEIKNSNWLNLHLEQNIVPHNKGYKHYKLCFNAAGIFEVLCTEVKNET